MKLHSCYIHKGVQPSDQKMFILGIFKREASRILAKFRQWEMATYGNTAVSLCSWPVGTFRPEEYANQAHNFINLNFCDVTLFLSIDHFRYIKIHTWL